MSDAPKPAASFEFSGDNRSRVMGTLHFSTVSTLLGAGIEAINLGQAAVIDLAGVTDSDSSGLALLIEWLSEAKLATRDLQYENIPSQLQQLARLSELERIPEPAAGVTTSSLTS